MKKNIINPTLTPPPLTAKKNFAFTLAEVLITLAIIGVVAALTIPTLISNYQKHQYVTQLKKNYSTLTNGFKQIMASDGVVKLSDTVLIQSINGGNTGLNQNQSAFRGEFAKHFKVLKSYDEGTIPQADKITYKPLKTGGDTESYYFDDMVAFFMSDGSIYYVTLYKDTTTLASKEYLKEIIALGSKEDDPIGTIAIDVNGKKEPNQWGRDAFWFDINNDGRLIAYGGVDFSLFIYRDKINTWHQSGELYCDTTSSGVWGHGCTARIIEEGWQMNY